MNFQTSLFDKFNDSNFKRVHLEEEIFIITLNIANPSLLRAKLQLEWLVAIDANVIILTEIKYSIGCSYIECGLKNAGYSIYNETSKNDKYGVLIGIKRLKNKKVNLGLDYLKSRVLGVDIELDTGNILIVGLYVPSRGKKEERNKEKRIFQAQISKFLKFNSHEKLIVAGDLNVIPRDHIPPHQVFGEWEYTFYEDFCRANLVDTISFFSRDIEHTWYSRSGVGFRFDFIFMSKGLIMQLKSAEHIHDTRLSKLSDHSAVIVKLNKI